MKKPQPQEVLAVLAAISEDPVDELGALMAQAAPLNARIDQLKQIVAHKGVGVQEGNAFDAVVSEQPGREGWDADMLKRVLNPVQWIACRKRGVPYLRVDVKAKK